MRTNPNSFGVPGHQEITGYAHLSGSNCSVLIRTYSWFITHRAHIAELIGSCSACLFTYFQFISKSPSSSSGRFVHLQRLSQKLHFWLITSCSPLTCFLTAHCLLHFLHDLNSWRMHSSSTMNSEELRESRKDALMDWWVPFQYKMYAGVGCDYIQIIPPQIHQVASVSHTQWERWIFIFCVDQLETCYITFLVNIFLAMFYFLRQECANVKNDSPLSLYSDWSVLRLFSWGASFSADS